MFFAVKRLHQPAPRTVFRSVVASASPFRSSEPPCLHWRSVHVIEPGPLPRIPALQCSDQRFVADFCSISRRLCDSGCPSRSFTGSPWHDVSRGLVKSFVWMERYTKAIKLSHPIVAVFLLGIRPANREIGTFDPAYSEPFVRKASRIRPRQSVASSGPGRSAGYWGAAMEEVLHACTQS